MTIEDYQKDAEDKGFIYFVEYLDSECYRKINMYYHGWECDNYTWIMSNSDKISTNHGDFYIASSREFSEYRTNLKNYLTSIEELWK